MFLHLMFKNNVMQSQTQNDAVKTSKTHNSDDLSDSDTSVC